MAKQTGKIVFTGTIDGITGYKMNGKYFARAQSSLTRKRYKKDAAFTRSRRANGVFAQASKIGSVIYNALPKDFRQHWMFRSFTGEANKLLKAGLSVKETAQKLSQTYL